MKAVIVYKENKGYSFKSEDVCMWCKGKWFVSIEQVKVLFPQYEYHEEILPFEASVYSKIKTIFNAK